MTGASPLVEFGVIIMMSTFFEIMDSMFLICFSVLPSELVITTSLTSWSYMETACLNSSAN